MSVAIFVDCVERYSLFDKYYFLVQSTKKKLKQKCLILKILKQIESEIFIFTSFIIKRSLGLHQTVKQFKKDLE
jgi:hypothetical protein